MLDIAQLAAAVLAVTVMLNLPTSSVQRVRDPEYTMENGYFTNNIDGYSLQLDDTYTVDTSLAQIVTVLHTNQTRIEIYKQDRNNGSSDTYARYSNGFLTNTKDHHKLSAGWERIGNYSVYVTAWYRDKLARVDGDKNYYVTFDLPSGQYIYSIFIKTQVPFDSAQKFYGLIESFETFDGKVMPASWSSEALDMDERGWNLETRDYFIKYIRDADRLSWGLYEPLYVCGMTEQVEFYEERIDYRFPVILSYSHFYEDPYEKRSYLSLEELLELAWSDGKIVELSLQATSSEDGGNRMYDILDGDYDEFLRYYAETIAEFAHPVLFRLHNEMNGDWCPYSSYNTSKDTMIFKEVYWYIYEFFEEYGANRNAIWVWNPNGRSFPDYDWNHSLMYYPGDEYVDIVGMTAYNTGTYYAEYGERWQEFEELYAALYAEYCSMFSQPLMITEFSCADMGGDKNLWVENMFRVIQSYDRIKIAVWWDSCDYDANGAVSRSYVLDQSPELLEIFRQKLAMPVGTRCILDRYPRGVTVG